jgi:glutathione synthase/RimK-type ligase-like ATP-grasp enzyme
MQYKRDWKTTVLVKEATDRLGIMIDFDPNFTLAGKLIWPDGFTSYWASTSFDINTSGAARISKDKQLTQFFMRKSGVNTVPESFLFHQPIQSEEIQEVVTSIGFPMVVKPNRDMLARGVSLVADHVALPEAIECALKQDRSILFQTYIPGDVYRVTVLDGVVQYVLRKGAFRNKGVRVDITDLHADFQSIAIRATQAVGLRWAGVDMIIEGCHMNQGSICTVLEVNSAPALCHYAEISSETRERTIQTIINILQAIHSVS